MHVTSLKSCVPFHQGIHIDLWRSRHSSLFLENHIIILYHLYTMKCLVFFSSIASCLLLFFLNSGISSFSSEASTEVSIYTLRPVMTFLALKAERCVLESMNLWRVSIWYKIPEGLLSVEYTYSKATY